MAFKTSATPEIIPAGEKHVRSMTIMVIPGSGNVQLQFQDDAGTWFTPDSSDYTITLKGPVTVERANTPSMRVIATGDARFEVIRSQ